MSVRQTQLSRKKRRIVIVALLAIAIAETGYILYAFGILTGGAAGPQRISSLELILRIACIRVLQSEQLCEMDIRRALLSRADYVVVRYVDLLGQENMSKFIKSTLRLAENSSIELIDVLLLPSLDIATSLTHTINSIIGRTGRTYVTYPLTFEQAGVYYAALLNTLIVLRQLNVTLIGNITSLDVANTTSAGNYTIIKLVPHQAVNYSTSLVLLNLTFTLRRPIYVSENNRTEVEYRLYMTAKTLSENISTYLCYTGSNNRTACNSTSVLAWLYRPLIRDREVYGLSLFSLQGAPRFSSNYYLNITLRNIESVKLINTAGIVFESKPPVQLVVVGSRLNRNVLYAVVTYSEKLLRFS